MFALPEPVIMKWTKLQLSADDLQAIAAAKKKVKKIQLLHRLQCLTLKSEGWKHKELANFFGVDIHTISNWLKAYQRGGLEELLKWKYLGNRARMTLDQQQQLQQRNKQQPFTSAKQAKEYMKKELGLEYHLHWIHKLLKRNFAGHTKS